MKNNVIKYYIAAIFLCSTIVTFAQPGTDDGTGTLEGGDTGAPIDGYVLVLAVLGMIYVFLRLRALNRTKHFQS